MPRCCRAARWPSSGPGRGGWEGRGARGPAWAVAPRPARPRTRQVRLEEEVRQRARLVDGARPAAARAQPPSFTFGPDEARRALGGRALVELIECEGTLHAVTLTADGPARLHRLGPASSVEA